MAAHPRVELLNEERDFRLHELFFSTTDTRGVIRHGNDVFSRIAGISLDELIGAPHSIIRHPDMPRAVFRLLWDTIENGKTIAAYVKNLAADGRYYWVLAVAMPIEDGYLSVRMKPSSPILPLVRAVYQRMRNLEQSIEQEPKQRVAAMQASTALLEKELNTLGFPNYEAFMLHALATELSSRQVKLDQEKSAFGGGLRNSIGICQSQEFAFLLPFQRACSSLDGELKMIFGRLEHFKQLNLKLTENSKRVLRSAESIRTLSINATIAANKMGTRAATLLVVAEALGAVSNTIQSVITELAARTNSVIEVLNQLMFDVAATKLQCEVSLHFLDELLEGILGEIDDKLDQSLHTLFHEMISRVTSVFDHLQSTEGRMVQLQSQLELLQKGNRTLRFVQFAGKKESSGSESGFGVVFDEVRSHIDQTRLDCDSLSDSIQESLEQIRSLQKLKGRLSPSLQMLSSLSELERI